MNKLEKNQKIVQSFFLEMNLDLFHIQQLGYCFLKRKLLFFLKKQ